MIEAARLERGWTRPAPARAAGGALMAKPMTERELERLSDLLLRFSETTWPEEGETRDMVGRLRRYVELRLEEPQPPSSSSQPRS